jgi:hypothetical protein
MQATAEFLKSRKTDSTVILVQSFSHMFFSACDFLFFSFPTFAIILFTINHFALIRFGVHALRQAESHFLRALRGRVQSHGRFTSAATAAARSTIRTKASQQQVHIELFLPSEK